MPAPQPLPNGWTDTGISRSVASTCSGQFLQLCNEGSLAIDGKCRPAGAGHNQLFLGHWTIQDAGTVNDPVTGLPYLMNIRGTINKPDGAVTVTVEQLPVTTQIVSFAPDTTLDSPFSSVYTVTETEGPFRLGCRLVVINEAADLPFWAGNYRLEYAWFRDASTGASSQLDCPGGSFAYSWLTGSNPPTAVGTEIGSLVFGWGRADFVGDKQYASLTNLTADGVAANTAELLLTSITNGNLRMRGTGSEAVGETTGGGSTVAGVTAEARAPYRITEDLSALDTAERDRSATILDVDGNLLTTTHVGDRNAQVANWTITQPSLSVDRCYALQAAWCLAQDPPVQTDDRGLLLWMPPPRQIANNGGEHRFYPVTFQIAGETDWQRPDGGRPSDWVSSDTDKLTVTEHATYTEIHVLAAGATAGRTLLTTYPARIGMSGQDDPAFGFGRYENQTHQAGEDLFSLGSWAYMDWRVQGPSDLLLTVEGNWYDLTDNYNTSGEERRDGYEVTPIPYTVTYSIAASGLDNPPASRIDLNFPDSAESAGSPLTLPFYHGQVTRMTLSGFQAGGTYLIHSALLIATAANLKHIYPHQVQRDNYTALHWSVNGSPALMNHGDQEQKPPEPATAQSHGGALRIINISQSNSIGPVDTQFGLQDSVTRAGGVEGMQVTWDSTAFETACQDPDGHNLGAGLAQWLLPVPGLAFFPNCLPPCAVVVGQVRICNGFGFYIRGRTYLGGSLESLAITDGGDRVEAGAIIKAIRDDTNGEVGVRGLTDADGFVTVHGVPMQGSLSVHLEEA